MPFIEHDVVPSDLMARYVEKFFTHLHNASLIVHKETFLADLEAGHVPPMLSLSVAAIASRSLTLYVLLMCRFCNVIPSEEHLPPRQRGKLWAERASVLALQFADRPSLVTVQTLINICLYWFGYGEMTRAFVHHGVLIRLLQALGLDHLEPKSSASANWINYELRVRVFWGCWLIDSFSSSRTGQTHILVRESITTPLPCTEDEFASRKRTTKLCRLIDKGGSESVLALLMQAAALW